MAINVPLVSSWEDRGLKAATRDLDTFGRKAKASFASLAATGRKLALGFAALGAAGVKIGKDLASAGETASTSNARIRQIATSMELFGDQVDNVSSRLVEYAEKTARATGVDQNNIKATQAKLLTFAELAKTADVLGGEFDRATKAAIDLAAAGFGSAETNAVQLGKALNDPIKGITALTRSGVTFTAAEQDLIKTLVQSGKQSEAQQMVLAAIEKQVGGTAEATANASDQMRVAFTQLQERLGMKLLPIFQRFAAFVVDRLYPAIERFTRFAWGRLVDAFQSARPFLERVAAIFEKYIRPAIERLVKFMQDNEDVVKAFFIVLAGAAAIALLAALASALGALLTPFGLIVAAIGLVVGAAVYMYNRFEWFKNAMDAIGRWFRDSFPIYFHRLADNLRYIWDGMWEAMLAMGRWFHRTWINEDSMWHKLVIGLWHRFWPGVKTFFAGIVEAMLTLWRGFRDVFLGIWNTLAGLFTADWSRMWEGIKQIMSGVFTVMLGLLQLFTVPFRTLWAAFGNDLTLIWRLAWAAIRLVFDTVAKILTASARFMVDSVLAVFNFFRQQLINVFNGIKTAVLFIWDNTIGRIISGVQAIVGAVQTAINAIKELASVPIPNPLGAIGGAIGGIVGGVRNILPFADGGMVTRPTIGLIGEAGPEVVVPLDRLEGLGGGGTVNVYVQGSVVSEKDLIEQIRIGLIRSQRSGRPLVA